jgi:hypothetical protein
MGTNQLVEDSKDLYRQLVEFGIEEKRQAVEGAEDSMTARLRKGILKELLAKSNEIKDGLVLLRERGSEPQPATEIRNLSWAGDISFAAGLKQAEVCWTEALEQILLTTRPVETYPECLRGREATLAQQLGIPMCFNAAILLHKLASACFYHRLNRQRSAFLLAADLLHAPFFTCLKSPSTPLQMVSGRATLADSDLQGVEAAALAQACESTAWRLLDYGEYQAMLPLLQIL